MFSTIRRYEGVKNSAEIGRRVNAEFVPLVKKLQGFVAYYWVDAGNGVVVSTTIFDNRAGAVESDRIAIDWAKKTLGELSPNPPQITEGEVIATSQPSKLAA